MDLVSALHNLDTPVDKWLLKTLYALATGEASKAQQPFPGSALSADKLFSMLCEPTSGGDKRLLPPYGALCKEYLNASGDVLEPRNGGRYWLPRELCCKLWFFSEALSRSSSKIPSLTHVVLQAVSTAVLRVLADNGVGVRDGTGWVRPVACAAEILHVPQLKALLEDGNNSRERHAHSKRVQKRTRRPGTAIYDATVGTYCVNWVRNVSEHARNPAVTLDKMGLTVGIIQAMVNAAADVMLEASWQLDNEDMPWPYQTSETDD